MLLRRFRQSATAFQLDTRDDAQPDNDNTQSNDSGLSGWAIFLILLLVIVILGAIGWVLYSRYRAKKLGLPPPSLNPFARSGGNYRGPAPAPGGIQGWVADKWNGLRNGRSAGGAYESTGYGAGIGGGRSSFNERRGFGNLDPDEAWDARVDHEIGGPYEEQELGLQDPSRGPYGGGGYGPGIGVGGIEVGRGRSRSRQRELDDRYDAEMHAGGGAAAAPSKVNPFGDHAETSNMSLRSVSPRPDGGPPRANAAHAVSHKRGESSLTVGSADNSPTERRSMFRENMD